MSTIDSPKEIEIEGYRGLATDEEIALFRARELRAAALGSKDQETTEILRGYFLPDQEYVRETGGKKVEVVRALLDPQEYVVKVEKPDELVAQVNQDRQNQLTSMREVLGQPDLQEEDVWLWHSYEVVIGNPSFPHTVYRNRLMNAWIENGKLVLTVQGNIEHEKLGAVIPEKGQQGGVIETEDEKKPRKKLQVSLSDLTEEQALGMKHPGIAIGLRTGTLISHQRSPKEMTLFADDQVDIIVDKSERLWVVITDADALVRKKEEA